MDSSKREQAWVGLFVLIASGLLLGTVFALSGAFGGGGVTYHTHFKFAAGMQPGTPVSYAGVKVGRIEQLRIDPQKPGMVEVIFKVTPETPVKTDSVVKIISFSALGENQMEISAGSPQAAQAPDGAVLPSKEFFGISQLADTLESLSPDAKKLVENLNKRVEEMQVTIARVNDLINDKNRAEVAKSLENVRGMLEENRPKLKATMANVEATSAKMPALVDDFKKTMKNADQAVVKIDEMLGENRPDIRAAIQELRRTLASASVTVDQLNRTLNYNAENIDETLENIRITTENLKQFTDTIRTRPSSLIRSSGPAERKPGDPPKN